MAKELGNEQLLEAISRMTVADLLAAWPETAVVFQRHQMACAGCAVAPFYTAADAAEIYGLSPDQFLAELVTAVAEMESPA